MKESSLQRVFLSMPDRGSHMSFFHEGRDWRAVRDFWSSLITQNVITCEQEKSDENQDEVQNGVTSLPQWVLGERPYTVTNMSAIHACGEEEFLGYHSRGDKKKGNKRKTFGLRIGYDGSKYQGYQSQGSNNAGNILTVEDDVKLALGGLSSMSAGRTDKDVSAISQVVSCHTFDQSVTPEYLKRRFVESTAVKNGRLTLFDCAQVPKKFHALFSATWRRYLYLFPLNVRRNSLTVTESIAIDNDNEFPVRWFQLIENQRVENSDGESSGRSFCEVEVDVDVEYINKLLQSLEGEELSYNGFAYKDFQKTNRGALASRGAKSKSLAMKNCIRKGEEMDIQRSDDNDAQGTSNDFATSIGDISGINRDKNSTTDATLDKCTLHKASASVVDLSCLAHRNKNHDESIKANTLPELALCVELVGSRFLRRMVRILVATVIRECQLPREHQDHEVLIKICRAGLRDRSSLAITGEGLAMAGVGYDLQSLAIPKFGTTTTNPKKLQRKAMKRARAEQQEREMEDNLFEVTQRAKKTEGSGNVVNTGPLMESGESTEEL